MVPLIIVFGKLILFISRKFNIGSGGTWPGEIALIFKHNILSDFISQIKKGVIIIAGTNGKTTTSKMVTQIIGQTKVIHNRSGANLMNGLVSAFIESSSLTGKINADYAVLEVDENTLIHVILNCKVKDKISKKLIIVLLNLFRDQLDRYGEVDIIANKWQEALDDLPQDSTVILNADDPLIAYLGSRLKNKVVYFGINRPNKFLPKFEHATDSIYCRKCNSKLRYKGIYFSHLGIWFCEKCGNRRPKPTIENYYSPLPGLYNEYNSLAAISIGRELGVKEKEMEAALVNFTPAFGRQEEFNVNGKRIKVFLSKNPAGFNASLKTILDLKPTIILFVLNDRIPDGRDISWIWDVDFEILPQTIDIIVSGDRAYDMGLRIKYTMRQCNDITMKRLIVEKELKKAIKEGLNKTKRNKTLYILPTYSAMLEVREILTGRKIL